jgi:hypothetical protein
MTGNNSTAILFTSLLHFAETSIDPGRLRWTCYRAANWKLLGLSTERGKDSTANPQPFQKGARLSADTALPRAAEPVMKKKVSRRRIDVDVDELDRIIEAAMRAPLNEAYGRTP